MSAPLKNASSFPRWRGSPTVWVVICGVIVAHSFALWQGRALPDYFQPLDWALTAGIWLFMLGVALANYFNWLPGTTLLSWQVVVNAVYLLSKLAYAMYGVGTVSRINIELSTTMHWLLSIPMLVASMRVSPAAQQASRLIPLALILLSGGLWLRHTAPIPDDIWFALAQLWLAYVTILLSAQFITNLRSELRSTQAKNQRLSRLAYFDDLTSLANRSALQLELDTLLQEGQHIGVLSLDLDGFKAINDTLGHAIGDEVLQVVAQRLREIARGNLCLARVSGDEFVVLWPSDQHTELEALATRLIDQLGKVLIVQGELLSVGVSVGISRTPHDAEDARSLLRRADQALWQVKRRGKNGLWFYSPPEQDLPYDRPQLERELRHALARDEFRIAFQPICTLPTGRPHACEVLLRWDSPSFGPIAPDEFITIAEEGGLMVQIGEWVLHRALAVLARWRTEPGLEKMRIAINVSPLQLLQPHFPDFVRSALATYDLPPSALELEVTEGLEIHDRQQIRACLTELSRMEVTLSLDDFGTGYASLSRLRDLPLQVVKIDKSFVTDLIAKDPQSRRYARSLIEAMSRVASALHLKLVGEGVESIEQARLLYDLGCHSGQGYLFSRPLPEEEMRQWLRSQQLEVSKTLSHWGGVH